MSDLPDGWTSTPISEVADLVRGVTYKKADASASPVNGYLPILRATNINGKLSLESEMVFVPDRYIRREQRMRVGDIVVATSSGSASVVGKSAELKTPWEGGFGAFCTVIRPSPELAPRYLAHMVASPRVREHWRKLAQGTNINNLKSSDLANTVIALPPFAEQGRIVAAIEEHFSRLDAGVGALERVQQNLKRMRDVVRFAATLGQLVPQDPEDEPAASLIARVKPTGRFRGSKPLPSGLGSLPPGWSWALMGSLAQRVTVGHVGPMKDEYIDDGIPFLRSQNVREDRFDPSGLRFISPSFHKRLSKSRLTPGDLVIVRSGNVGTACVIPDWLGDEANCADLVIVQRPEALDPHYAALYMNSLARSRVRAGRVGVALTHFNTQSVAELPVPVPPMSEQKRIVAKAQRLISVVDSLEEDLIEGLRKASALRSSILASAFSGRLGAQDSTEEPASMLLKRIVAERVSSDSQGPKQGRKPRAAREKITA